jgi:hypothetical protein
MVDDTHGVLRVLFGWAFGYRRSGFLTPIELVFRAASRAAARADARCCVDTSCP